MAEQKGINALGREAAYQLANVTKTAPQFAAITPRWVSRFLDYKGLESGIYRVNKVVEGRRRWMYYAARIRRALKYPRAISSIRPRRVNTSWIRLRPL